MPEGDTIYRSARALGRALTGKTVTGFATQYAQIARANDEQPFRGQTISAIEARGKWLLIHFTPSESEFPAATEPPPASEDTILATHMLMSGSWHIYRPGEKWWESRANARITLETADFVAVAFRVPVAKIHTGQSLLRDRAIPKPEGDVLRPDFDPQAAVQRLFARGTDELAHAILRQSVLAGVGNVYKSEICFLLGHSPFRPANSLTQGQAEEIVALAQKLLAANVLEDSPDQIVTYQGNRRTTRNSNPADRLWVYGRKNQPCRKCGTPIQRCIQGPDARSTYWCPHCQPLP